MIPLNQEQRLGRKAYILMALHELKPGFIILLIALIALALSSLAKTFIPALYVDYIVIGLFILTGVACFMSVITAKVVYRNYTFTFEEFGMKLKRGMMKIVEVTIPYRQMQDVGVERGFIHQITGTSRLIINSAGHEEVDEKNETDIVLDPIQKEVAEEIRLMLQRKIGVQVVESEKEADREAVVESFVPKQQQS
jgi:uncharacterized membrane protein YdbT with pleckstrin-like domain